MARYIVAPGRSVTTRKGPVRQNSPITAKMLGSKSVFDALVNSGVIVEIGKAPVLDRTIRVNLHRHEGRTKKQVGTPIDVAKANIKNIEIIEASKPVKIERKAGTKRAKADEMVDAMKGHGPDPAPEPEKDPAPEPEKDPVPVPDIDLEPEEKEEVKVTRRRGRKKKDETDQTELGEDN